MLLSSRYCTPQYAVFLPSLAHFILNFQIYCVSQNLSMSTNEISEKILQIDRSINEITNKTKEMKEQINIRSQKLTNIQNTLTLEEAIDKKNNLEKEIENVTAQLQELDEVEAVCPKRKVQIEKGYEKYLNEYKKRKRMCMDILNTILENYPKSKEHLFEEVGIETDQDQNFSLNNL